MFFDHRCFVDTCTSTRKSQWKEFKERVSYLNDANDAVTHMSSTCRSIRNYLPDRTDSTPSDLVDGHGRLAALTTNPVAAGITTCQPPTNPPCSSWHARASSRRTRPRVRNFPVDGERWSYANLTDAGSRHEPTIPRRRPVSTMSQPKALLPLPLGAVARLVARAGRAIYVGNRAALHDPARLAALFQRSDDLHRASSEGERREEGGDRGRDCLLQQHWRQSGGPPPKTQAEHCGRPRGGGVSPSLVECG